jgi:hypothetical protein
MSTQPHSFDLVSLYQDYTQSVDRAASYGSLYAKSSDSGSALLNYQSPSRMGRCRIAGEIGL